MMDILFSCPLFHFGKDRIFEKYPKCNQPREVVEMKKCYEVSSIDPSDLASPKEKILYEKGFNGKVSTQSFIITEHGR
jgi:hypothetical protein